MSPKVLKLGADWSLLYGILAVNLDLVRRESFIAALHVWSREKGRNIADILLSQGAIDKEMHLLLDAIVKKHLSCHENSLDRSLASIQPVESVRRELKMLGDADLTRSFKKLGTGGRGIDEADPFATQPDLVETSGRRSTRFQVVRLHARGGLGEVFVASDSELDRTVALKEIQMRYSDHPDSRARFIREAKLTGKLEHPGIVPIYSLGHFDDGRLYYAMRLIEGRNLKESIDEFHGHRDRRTLQYHTLEFRRLLGKFVDVCTTVDFAHSRGVLHRDIKPGNIMLGPHGETLVVDWGLAKVFDPSSFGFPQGEGPGASARRPREDEFRTLPGSALGTPQYMSPEQAAGKLDLLGPASDIYSLGATLFTILTGEPSISGNDPAAIVDRVKAGEFPTPVEIQLAVPRPLNAVCLKAMALLPERRYASAKLLAEDVELWLAGEPVSCYRESLARRLWRWGSRNRWVARAVGLATVFFVILYLMTSLVFGLLGLVWAIIGAIAGAVAGIIQGRVRQGVRRGAELGFQVGMIVSIVFISLYYFWIHYLSGSFLGFRIGR